jgi:hypothetical protein
MKNQKKATKPTASGEKELTFESVHQMTSYFFPETDASRSHPNGDEHGDAVAERVFTEVTHSRQK